MNIHNRSTLISFYRKHADYKDNLEKWFHDVSSAKYRKPSDVVKDFNSARTIRNNRAIFGINNNDYRMIVEFNFEKGWVFIKFLGTHAQYDKIAPETIDLFKPAKNKYTKK